MRILLVDDDASSQKILGHIMRSIGQCHAVDSGHKAVEAFSEALQQGQPFDLVTLDVIMPGKDGMETLLDMRELEAALPTAKRAVIIMVTSVLDKDAMVTAMQAGCDDYVIKPIDRLSINRKLTKFGFLRP